MKKINLSNLNKIWFPDSNITKRDIINYYEKISPIILKYLKDRPISMQRFPHGISQEGFYQKDMGSYFPSWIDRIKINKQAGGYLNEVVCNKKETIIYLVNQACIVFHTWLSKKDKLNIPDKIVFDLDPGKSQDFALVKKTALKLKDILEKQNLVPYVLLTGSKGLHVVIPIVRKYNFDIIRAWARNIADNLVLQDQNNNLTTEIRINKRKGRLFIDTNRNAFAQTSVCPYSIRALPGAPLAVPVSWQEVATGKLKVQQFNIKNIDKRLDQVGDLWQDFYKNKKRLLVK